MRAIQSNRRQLTLGVGVLAVAGSVGWWSARALAAAIPAANALHYAGTLAEKGVPVDGPRDITIVLWSSSVGSADADKLCTTEAGSTPVAAGRFEVLLDDACTTAVADHPESWAEVQVGGVSFGRQKIGAVPYAVAAANVDGMVKPDAVRPNYANDGSLGRGAGEASIYNDGSDKKELLVTGNNAAGGVHKIGLVDDVRIGRNLSVAGNVDLANATISGKAEIGVYVKEDHSAGVYNLYCNYDAARQQYDRAISGGAICGPGDTFIMESRPLFATPDATGHLSQGSAQVGWHTVCTNHDFAFSSAPAHIYAVCLSHAR